MQEVNPALPESDPNGLVRPDPPLLQRLRRAAAQPGWRVDRLGVVRHGYTLLLTLAAILQLLFFSSFEDNAVCTLLAYASSLIGVQHSLSGKRFRMLPISALMLLLYTTTATAGALLIKTQEWSPLADRLSVPKETFSVLLLWQVMLVVADFIYLKATPLQRCRRWLTRRVMVPAGAMRWPDDGQLWLLGLFGLLCAVAVGSDFESEATFGFVGAGGKILRGFAFLKYAPFLIPFRDALGGWPRRIRVPLTLLCGYFAMLVGLSFATNSRSTFADAVPTIAICLLSAQALGRFDMRRIPPARLLTIGVIALVGFFVLSRVALAMVVARDYRYGASAMTVVSTTIEALFNSDWLAAAKAKMDNVVMVGNYSEDYVDSRFFARFLLTKFHDNMLYFYSLMGPDQISSYKGFMVERFAANFPDPLLRLVGLSIDKQDLIVSNGDYVVYLVDGWGLGGFKTGSMIAEVFAVFGWWSPLWMIGCGLGLFTVYDSLVMPTVMGRMAMSPVVLLLIWNLCGTTAAFGLGSETVTGLPGGVLRLLPQSLLMYAIAVWCVSRVTHLWGRLVHGASLSRRWS